MHHTDPYNILPWPMHVNLSFFFSTSEGVIGNGFCNHGRNFGISKFGTTVKDFELRFVSKVLVRRILNK